MTALILFSALLPGLFWDQGPETAAALREAGIERLYVRAGTEEVWKKQGFAPIALDADALQKFQQLAMPGVQYRVDVASATRAPWVDANGWRIQRGGARTYYYDVPGRAAGLAAAEAFAYDSDAVIHTETAGLQPFGQMLAFLRRIGAGPRATLANIGVVDDGSAALGEVMNLLARHNLLFRIVPAPDSKLDVNVRPSSKDAANPAVFAQKIRQQLTDDKRLLRIYGSDVVLARLTGDGSRTRLHLLNYSGRQIYGLRIRVLGSYANTKVAASGLADAKLVDLSQEKNATEFTLPEIDVYALIDLSR